MKNFCAVVSKGRPREFDPNVALAAALRVFWRRGYEGASMAELTAEMGLTKPSLYGAFGNKESLFRKALDLYEREKLGYMQTALEAETSRGVAERLLYGALDMQSSTCGDPKGCLSVISSVACGTEAESVREEVVARTGHVKQQLVERFERAQSEGDLPSSVDAAALARYLSAVTQGLAVQASSGATCAELRGIVETTLAAWPGR